MSYIIYKICCDDLPEFIYVGSTKAFRQRKSLHKQRVITYNTKLYSTIRENGGWDNWRMIILEDIGDVSLTQARIKEEEHRLNLNANLNMLKCYRTEEEIKEQQKELYKNWYNNNKEHKKKQVIEWKKNNNEKITCECGRIIIREKIKRHLESKIHLKNINN